MGAPLKLLHTSDWHLGKKLFKLERLPEQERFLAEILGIIKREGVHHLLVAGDIFDVPQPPHRALRVFYDFIATLTATTTCEMWVIGGNHDSGTLLDAPAGLIDEKRIHLFGGLRANSTDHWVKLPLPSGLGHVDLCLLPYFRHHELAPWKGDIDVTQPGWPEELVRRFLAATPSQTSAGRILMAHHLFGMFEAAGSEQALALSGLESIPLDWLSSFDYAALGHIHKPQTLRKQKPFVRYCGSPIAMRFSETAPKGVELLAWDENGFTNKTLPLTTWRPLLSMNLTQENWKKSVEDIPPSELPAAIEIYLKLKAPVPGLVEEIRLDCEKRGLELLSVMPQFEIEDKKDAKENWTTLLKLTPEELFNSFYLSKFPEEAEVPTDLAQDMRQLWEEARRAPPST